MQAVELWRSEQLCVEENSVLSQIIVLRLESLKRTKTTGNVLPDEGDLNFDISELFHLSEVSSRPTNGHVRKLCPQTYAPVSKA